MTGLPFGEYLLTSSSNKSEIYYYLFDVNFKHYKWDLEGFQPSTIGMSFVLPNNTLMITQPETDNGWSFKAIDLHKFNNNNGYSNANIKTTSPTIGSSINSNDIQNFTISFYDKIELSDGLIQIYQINGD